tara:strand:+ start:431 stop:919 length:489 start_codon:yes stop_codon:yes gene_type:complete
MIEIFENFLEPNLIKLVNEQLPNSIYKWDTTNKDKVFQGFNQLSYPLEKDSNIFLNIAAMGALKKLQETKKIQNKIEIQRVLLNVVPKDVIGAFHKDYTDEGLYSFILNISDSDGGTEVEDVFYEHKFNNALLFPSNTLHRGVGPKNSLVRINLAIVFKVLN